MRGVASCGRWPLPGSSALACSGAGLLACRRDRLHPLEHCGRADLCVPTIKQHRAIEFNELLHLPQQRGWRIFAHRAEIVERHRGGLARFVQRIRRINRDL